MPGSLAVPRWLLFVLVASAGGAVPAVARAGSPPECFINGGTVYPGCVPAQIVFRIDSAGETKTYASLEAGIMAALAKQKSICTARGDNCKGIYRQPIYYTGAGNYGVCQSMVAAGQAPYLSRGTDLRYTITYQFGVYSQAPDGSYTCREGSQIRAATRYSVYGGNFVWGQPVCPTSYKLVLDDPNQWSGNFGYYCAPPRNPVGALSTSGFRATCQDGPRATCGEAGNPVDLADGRRKVESEEDLVVAGDFPIRWIRTYRSLSAAGGMQNWAFFSLRSADVVTDASGVSLASIARGDGSRLVFRATGSSGSRVWAPQWNGTVLYSVRSALTDWVEAGQLKGLVLSNDRGEREFYGLDGRLHLVENMQGRRHLYHYDTSGLLSEIEQEGGRSLFVTWQLPPSFNQTGVVSYEEYDPNVTGNGVPQSGSYAYQTDLSVRTDMVRYPVVRSVSDGVRTVAYGWNQTYWGVYAPRLLSVTQPDGRIWNYLYDPSGEGFLSGRVDPAGKTVASYVYGSSGSVIEEWKGPVSATNKIDRLVFGYGSVTDGLNHLYSFSGSDGRMFGYSTDCPVCRGPKAKTFEYNTQNQLTRATDFANYKTDYTYDAEGRLATVTEASGTTLARTRTLTWVPGYNLPNTLTEPVVAFGSSGTRTTTWAYNARHQPISQTISAPNSAGGTVTRQWTYGYDTDHRLSRITDPSGRAVDVYHNSTGDLIARVDDPGTSAERLTRWGGFQADGLPRWMVDANGVATVWTWDLEGRPLTARAGVPTSVPPAGVTLGAGTWTPVLPVSGVRTTSYVYNLAGLLEQVDGPDGTSLRLTYDAVNRLTRTDRYGSNGALEARLELTLDSMSNVTGVILRNAAGQEVRKSGAVYDAQYRVSRALDAFSQALWTQTFDAMHQPTSRLDALSRTTSQQFDALGRVKQQLDANGQAALLTYGPQDEVRTATDQRSVTTSYVYNGFGDIVSIVSPDRGTWTFDYDATGRRITATDPRGVVATTVYDGISRPVSVTYSDAGVTGTPAGFQAGTVVHAFSYDTCPNGVGRLCGFSDPTGTTAYAYDVWGDVVGKAWVGRTGTTAAGVTLSTGYGYTASTGQLSAVVLPSGKTLVLSYGNDGRVSGLDYSGQPVVANVQWTAFGAVAGWTWPMANGWSGTHSTVTFGYDLNGRPTSVADLDQRQLVWDAGDRLTGVNDPDNAARSQVYGYDALDRLTSAEVGTWGAAHTYAYDAVGNRTALTDTATGNGWQFAYGAAHNRQVSRRPVAAGVAGTTYASAYDAMGNLVDDGLGLQLQHDATGRLTWASKGGATVTSGYDALGRRATKTVAGGSFPSTRLYAQDEQGRPLGVYVVDGSASSGFRVEEEYVHLDGWRPVAAVRPDPGTGMANPQLFPILSDHLGTPRKVLDGATGETRWTWDAKDPFGHELPNETPTAGLTAFAFDLRFPGQRADVETGLFQNGFRDYHAGLGRYVQSDPLGLEAGWNTYSYVSSTPLSAADFLGLSEQDVVKIRNAVNQATLLWSSTGHRSPFNGFLGGSWNNLWGGIKGSFKLNSSSYMVCGSQADTLYPFLLMPDFDDQWTFERKHGGWHHWVEGTSSNPKDPHLILDPWVNEVDSLENVSNPRLYRTVDSLWLGWKIQNGKMVRDTLGVPIETEKP